MSCTHPTIFFLAVDRSKWAEGASDRRTLLGTTSGMPVSANWPDGHRQGSGSHQNVTCVVGRARVRGRIAWGRFRKTHSPGRRHTPRLCEFLSRPTICRGKFAKLALGSRGVVADRRRWNPFLGFRHLARLVCLSYRFLRRRSTRGLTSVANSVSDSRKCSWGRPPISICRKWRMWPMWPCRSTMRAATSSGSPT